MKKFLKFLLSILLPGLIGGLMGVCLIILTEYLTQSASLVTPGWLLLIFILSLFIMVAIHECFHLIGFLIRKVPCQVLFISPILFQKREGRWSVRLKLTKLFFIGGIVVPELPEIKSEADMDDFTNRLIFAVLLAPLSNVVIMVLLWAFFLMFGAALSPLAFDIFLVITLCSTFSGVLLVASCFTKNDTVIGDLRIHAIRSDKPLLIGILQQYASFSPAYPKECLLFLKQQATPLFEEAQPPYSGALCELVATNARSFLLKKDELDPNFERIANEVNDALPSFVKSVARENAFILTNILLYYKALCQDDREGAVQLFDRIYGIFPPKSKVEKYYYQRGLLVCGLEDTREYLARTRNIASSSAYEFLTFFDFYYSEEAALNHLMAENYLRQRAIDEAKEATL